MTINLCDLITVLALTISSAAMIIVSCTHLKILSMCSIQLSMGRILHACCLLLELLFLDRIIGLSSFLFPIHTYLKFLIN